VLAGESLYRIRRDWNSRGLLSSAGRPWRSQGVRLMLVRAAAAAFTERDGELLPGPWQPTLEESTWRRARELLTDPARTTRSFEQRSHRYPLSGLLFCGLCGQRLSASIMRYGLTYSCPEARAAGAGMCGSGVATLSATYSKRQPFTCSSDLVLATTTPYWTRCAISCTSCRTTTTTGCSTAPTTSGRPTGCSSGSRIGGAN
jgi:hypothetical protein